MAYSKHCTIFPAFTLLSENEYRVCAVCVPASGFLWVQPVVTFSD